MPFLPPNQQHQSTEGKTFYHSPLIISLVLFIFTLMPLFSTLSFHSSSNKYKSTGDIIWVRRPKCKLHAKQMEKKCCVMCILAENVFYELLLLVWHCSCILSDKMKPAVVAKLANQCSFLYADVLKQMQADAVKSLWPKVLACHYIIMIISV